MKQPGRLSRTWKSFLGGSLVAGAIVVDLVANGLLGGSFDETISSRAGRLAQDGSLVAKGLCAVLDAIDAGHCASAAAGR